MHSSALAARTQQHQSQQATAYGRRLTSAVLVQVQYSTSTVITVQRPSTAVSLPQGPAAAILAPLGRMRPVHYRLYSKYPGAFERFLGRFLVLLGHMEINYSTCNQTRLPQRGGGGGFTVQVFSLMCGHPPVNLSLNSLECNNASLHAWFLLMVKCYLLYEDCI